jgi:hypothetical protein
VWPDDFQVQERYIQGSFGLNAFNPKLISLAVSSLRQPQQGYSETARQSLLWERRLRPRRIDSSITGLA